LPAATHLRRVSSIIIQSLLQSRPKRTTTNRSSSSRIAWSTAHPVCKWGSRNAMAFLFLTR
jgi:hypothetical protein